MRYIIQDETRRRNCISEIACMDISSAVEVTIKTYKKNRTNSQNNLMWMWYPPIAEYTGYSEDELHEIFKEEFIGYNVFVRDKKLYIRPKSSTKLDTKAMTIFLNKVEFIANFLEVQLRYPDDYAYAMERL